ncbi:MAG: helix-turn-helix domain-containing protein [Prevotella sp.]|nr:helix-turn-helix domain-containing protein [Prevotella sp.]
MMKRASLIAATWLLLVIATAAATPASDYERWQQLPSELLMQMGSSYAEQTGMPDSALVCFTIVSNRYRKNLSDEEQPYVVGALNGKWFVYFFSFFDYAKSYESLARAEELCDEFHMSKARVYLNFGCMYQTIAEQTGEEEPARKAFDYFRRSIAEARQDGDLYITFNSMGNLIQMADYLNCLDSISEEYDYVKSLRDQANRNIYQYVYHLYDGTTAMNSGNYALAMKAFDAQQALVAAEPANVRYTYLIYNNKAKVSALQGDYAQAISYTRQCEQLANQWDMKDAKMDAYNNLADYARRSGQGNLAEHYQTKYFHIKDTLLNYHQMASVQEMEFLGEMKRIDEQMADMRHQGVVKNFIIGIVVCAAVVAALVLLIVWRKNRELNQTNRSLYEKNVALLVSEEQQRRERRKYKNSSLDLSAKEQLLQQIEQALEEHTAEICSPDFTLERLAELVGSNYKHVSQVINEQPDCNFNSLVNTYRIKEACRRMNDTQHYAQLTIEAIANSVGFRSANAFRSSFRRFTGLTPSEYQRQARQQSAES